MLGETPIRREAIPVRVDSLGQVTSVGLLLRATGQGTITRALVSGRVLYKERVRDALLRHLEKDLGPLALPRVSGSWSPFSSEWWVGLPDTAAWYHRPAGFPTSGLTPLKPAGKLTSCQTHRTYG